MSKSSNARDAVVSFFGDEPGRAALFAGNIVFFLFVLLVSCGYSLTHSLTDSQLIEKHFYAHTSFRWSRRCRLQRLFGPTCRERGIEVIHDIDSQYFNLI